MYAAAKSCLAAKKLLAGLNFRYQENGRMTNKFMTDWIKVVRNQSPGFLLNKSWMLILDALKGHLTQEVKGEIRRANIDLTVVPGGMMSQLLC
jgi:hypothetical protein